MGKGQKELVDAYKEGNIEALGKLFDQYKNPLYSFILRMVHNHAEADDVFQEVWLKAVKNLNNYRADKFLSWLFRIARNLVIDRTRKRKPEASLQDPVKDGSSFTLEHKVSEPGLGPDSLTHASGLGETIDIATRKLPWEQREVFWLRMENHLTFKEIASIQNCSVNTALARMQYALNKMRKSLGSVYKDLKGGS